MPSPPSNKQAQYLQRGWRGARPSQFGSASLIRPGEGVSEAERGSRASSLRPLQRPQFRAYTTLAARPLVECGSSHGLVLLGVCCPGGRLDAGRILHTARAGWPAGRALNFTRSMSSFSCSLCVLCFLHRGGCCSRYSAVLEGTGDGWMSGVDNNGRQAKGGLDGWDGMGDGMGPSLVQKAPRHHTPCVPCPCCPPTKQAPPSSQAQLKIPKFVLCGCGFGGRFAAAASRSLCLDPVAATSHRVVVGGGTVLWSGV